MGLYGPSEGGAGSIGDELIFRPAAVAPLDPGVYNDFTLLWAAFVATDGMQVIWVDPDGQGDNYTVTIPAGAYDFERRGVFYANLVTGCGIAWAAGATVTNMCEVGLYVELLNSADATPVFTASDSDDLILHMGAGISRYNANAAFFHVPNGVTANVALEGVASYVYSIDPTVGAVSVANGGTCNVYAYGSQARIWVDSVSGPLGSTVNLFSASCAYPTNLTVTQAAALGTLTRTLLNSAVQVGYAPAAPANWPTPSPQEVQTALDDLAATRSPVLKTARVVYINPATGNDANNGTSSATPWLTMAKMKADLEGYVALWSTYTVHLQGTGTLANVDLTIPIKGAGGAFDIVCDTYTSVAGPFTATAGSTTTVTVAAGLGINTWRAYTLRPLTGAAAVAGVKVSIAETTDTVATFAGGAISVAMALNDTFDVVTPAVALSGTSTWIDQSTAMSLLVAFTGITVPAVNTLANLKITGSLYLNQSLWFVNGLELATNTTARLIINNANVYSGALAVFNARVGMLNASQWSRWGVTQPLAGGAQSAVSIQGPVALLNATLVAPNLLVANVAPTGTTPWVGTDQSGCSLLIAGNLFGSTATDVLLLGGRLLVPSGSTLLLGGSGTSARHVNAYSTGNLIVQGTLTPRVTASIISTFVTRGGGHIDVPGTVTATVLTNAASVGSDARSGGSIRWNGAPTITGVLGDNIVSTTAGYFANAFFAAAGDGIANPVMAANICRQ